MLVRELKKLLKQVPDDADIEMPKYTAWYCEEADNPDSDELCDIEETTNNLFFELYVCETDEVPPRETWTLRIVPVGSEEIVEHIKAANNGIALTIDNEV